MRDSSVVGSSSRSSANSLQPQERERETHRTKFNQIKVCDHRVSAEPGAWYQLADTQFVVAAAAAAVMVMAVVAAVVKRRWKVTTKAV